MKVFKHNETGHFFGLLYTQNPENPKGGATPYVEPTQWFIPLEVVHKGRIPAKFEQKKGAWPVPLADKLVARVLVEFTGKLPIIGTTTTPVTADQGPKASTMQRRETEKPEPETDGKK